MQLYIQAFLMFFTVLSSTLYTGENAPLYTVRPYQDEHDHGAVFALITSKLGSLAGKEKAENEQERLYAKLDDALKHDKPMNRVSFEEGSFRNILVFDRNILAGMVTYLIKKDDNNCFIDTLCISPEYDTDDIYRLITQQILTYACQKKAAHIETYENKTRNKNEIAALTKIGFTETIRDEKKPESVTLTLHTSAVLQLFHCT